MEERDCTGDWTTALEEVGYGDYLNAVFHCNLNLRGENGKREKYQVCPARKATFFKGLTRNSKEQERI